MPHIGAFTEKYDFRIRKHCKRETNRTCWVDAATQNRSYLAYAPRHYARAAVHVATAHSHFSCTGNTIRWRSGTWMTPGSKNYPVGSCRRKCHIGPRTRLVRVDCHSTRVCLIVPRMCPVTDLRLHKLFLWNSGSKWSWNDLVVVCVGLERR